MTNEERLQCALVVFREALMSSWDRVQQLALTIPGRGAEEFLSDWAQATWEMLVEAAVSSEAPVYLEPYGEGADCNDIGSRVWHPGVSSTHSIRCVPVDGNTFQDALTGRTLLAPSGGLVLDQFVTLTENGWYRPGPPFDYVLALQDNTELVLPLDRVKFLLAPLP